MLSDLTGGLLLGSIRSFQLQAMYEMGSVRMVDRALTEGFSAEFLRLSRVVTEDLTKSLHHHHERVQEGALDLEAFMYRLIHHPLLVRHTKEVTAAVEKFKQMVAMNILLPLLHLDSARGDIAQFLSSHLKEVCAREESKILIEALTECLTNLQSQMWRLVRSSKLSDPEVANRVMIALLGTQPLVVNYHSGVLDGVVGRLGLTPPDMKEYTCSPSEGMLRRFLQDLECSVKADDSGKPMGWSLQGGLHTKYASDFMQRNRGEIHCVFHNNLLPNLIRDLDALHLSEPASPPPPGERFDNDQLIEQFKEMRVEGRKTLFSALVDCAKGFLTAEERDQMADFIRPDPAPLPPATTIAAPVVTTAGGTPLDMMPQPPVTTSAISLPAATTTVVVTAAVTLITTTVTTAVTTVVSPTTSTIVSTGASDIVRVSNVEPSIVPTSIMPQVSVINSSQQSLAPVIEVTGITPAVAVSGELVTPQSSSGVDILPAFPSLSGMFSSASQG